MLQRTRRADFFVVTSLDEFRAQKELQQISNERFSISAQTDRYVIYDLRTSRGKAETGDHAKAPRR
jgi:hypothetical protein